MTSTPTTISVWLNGNEKQLPAELTLVDALSQWQIASNEFAVAINQNFVPRHAYSTTQLKPEDQIELLVPMQGG